MKTTLLALAISVAALVGFSTNAEAGTKRQILNYVGQQFAQRPSYGSSYGHGHGHCTPYVVRTSEICRRCETRTGYRPCGSIYYYHVTVVTYRDYYSNGAMRTYTRTLA